MAIVLLDMLRRPVALLAYLVIPLNDLDALGILPAGLYFLAPDPYLPLIRRRVVSTERMQLVYHFSGHCRRSESPTETNSPPAPASTYA